MTNKIETIPITFIEGTTKKEALAKEGETLLDTCKRFDISILGACEGNCACSTCHIILEKDIFKKLPNPSEAEEDMLDLAYGVTPTSRLACQIKVNKDFINSKVYVLEMQRNVIIDQFKSKVKH